MSRLRCCTACSTRRKSTWRLIQNSSMTSMQMLSRTKPLLLLLLLRRLGDQQCHCCDDCYCLLQQLMLLSYQDSKHDHQLVVSDSIDSPHEHNNMMFVLQARPTLVPQWYLRPQQQHQPNRVVMIVVVFYCSTGGL